MGRHVTRIAGATLVVALLGLTNHAPARPAGGASPAARPADPATPSPGFPRFPVGSPVAVSLAADEHLRELMTDREWADQQRDGLLYAVMADSGLSPGRLNRALYDVPPVRHGFTRRIAHFEYHLTRTALLGGGRLLVLVPKCPDPEFADHLARAADEARKTLGAKPAAAVVFEYELDVAAGRATLTRRPEVPGEALFTTEAGYHEARVADLADFRAFMSRVQDLTFVRLDGNALTLGGRRGLARAYRGLRVEDVAAVWQAQDKLTRDTGELMARFDTEHKELLDRWNAKLQEELDKLRREHQKKPGGKPEVPGKFEIDPAAPGGVHAAQAVSVL